MQYADYEFYINEYFGDLIPEVSFGRSALQASQFIDYYTMGKAANYAADNAVKMACCAVAEHCYVIDKAQGLIANSINASGSQELQSESVGSYSRSFRSGGDSASAAIKAIVDTRKEMARIANQYLAATGLLYRGRGACTLRTL